jgi:hypothetical protein
LPTIDIPECAMSNISTNNHYYVYDWWAVGGDSPFYIGKGCRRRAWTYNGRSHKFINVINTLTEKKIKTEVRIIYNNLSEDEALRKESERITFWVRVFATLANIHKVYRNKSKQLRLATSYTQKPPKPITWTAPEAKALRHNPVWRKAECMECNGPFSRKMLKQKFCSAVCRNAQRSRLDKIKDNAWRNAEKEKDEKMKERLRNTQRIATDTPVAMKKEIYHAWGHRISEDGHQVCRIMTFYCGDE